MKSELNAIPKQEKKNFDFVDTIRCIAMMGIVMEHCVYNGTYIFDGFPPKHVAYISLIQLSKFGTIAFFILAGFLLGSKFITYSSWQYFKRRLSTVFVPWLIWSLIFLIVILIHDYIVLHGNGDFHLGKLLLEKAEMVYLFTNYWFIINFLFCIAVLLCFKKYLYKWWLGIIFLTLSLIYSANIYFEWFITSHTIAIFGFIFYLWFGAMLHKNWGKIDAFIRKMPRIYFIIFFVITFCLAVFDIMNLIMMHSEDPYNTLRFSNILYSIASVLLLFKIRDFGFVKYIKPRETTFGVYLIHYILVTHLLPEIFRPFNVVRFQDLSMGNMLLYVFCRFIIVYGTTLILINLIARIKLKWVIGR